MPDADMMTLAYDLAPEDRPPVAPLDERAVTDLIATPDSMAEPDPTEGTLAPLAVPTLAAMAQVRWPADSESPDYAHLAGHADPGAFELTPAVIEAMFGLNRFRPDRSHGVVAIALRGATLASGDEAVNVASAELLSVRPNHRTLRCVIGFYFPDTGRMTLFAGSTVPCPRYVVAQVGVASTQANMLPTGLYTYHIWRHRDLPVALRMSRGNGSSGDLEAGAEVSVLRSRNDGEMTTADMFDRSVPLDNVHCTYFLTHDAGLGANFSSAGCLTVRGAKTPGQQWAKFVDILRGVGERRRVDLALLTGKDAALVARNSADTSLAALRPGSRGPEVEALQAQLGLSSSGYFGAATADRLTVRQRQLNEAMGRGRIADGIWSRRFDLDTGWAILG